MKDTSKLTRKQITDRRGRRTTVWVKTDPHPVTTYFGLEKPKDIAGLMEGVKYILSQYSSKIVAFGRVKEYLNEHNRMALSFVTENGLTDPKKFENYMGSAYKEARKPILEERKAATKEVDKRIAEYHVGQIEKLALEAYEKDRL